MFKCRCLDHLVRSKFLLQLISNQAGIQRGLEEVYKWRQRRFSEILSDFTTIFVGFVWVFVSFSKFCRVTCLNRILHPPYFPALRVVTLFSNHSDSDHTIAIQVTLVKPKRICITQGCKAIKAIKAAENGKIYTFSVELVASKEIYSRD